MHNKEPTDVKTCNALSEEEKGRPRERRTAKAKTILENAHPTGKPPEKRTRTENRFWIKIDIRGHDECWEWQASIGADGYGTFWYRDVTRRAHRIAVILSPRFDAESLDDINGDVVKHSCDNHRCCNPQHLNLGSQRGNIIEAIERGHRNTDLAPIGCCICKISSQEGAPSPRNRFPAK